MVRCPTFRCMNSTSTEEQPRKHQPPQPPQPVTVATQLHRDDLERDKVQTLLLTKVPIRAHLEHDSRYQGPASPSSSPPASASSPAA